SLAADPLPSFPTRRSSDLSLAVPYMKALAFGLFPLLLYFAVRRCLQAMNMAQPIAFALVSANIINAFFNWILIYGKWGAPRMGESGRAHVGTPVQLESRTP